MIAYITAGLISVGLISVVSVLGYELLTWGMGLRNALYLLGAYAVLLCVAALLAFCNGLVLRVGLSSANKPDLFCMAVALLWVCVLVAGAIYPWFIAPFTTEFVVIRVFGGLLALSCSLWAFLMVSMMGAGKQR